MNPVKILFLAANPSDTAQLKTDEERHRIEAEILKSPHRDRIQFIYEPAIQPCSLIEAFRRHRPQIIHFSGHGSEANEIILVSDEGTSRLVGTDTIVELFRLQGKGVRVVLLNACYSRSQAEALTRYVDFAIGMSEAIPDQMAIDFASAFYQGLAYGEPVRAAFDASLLQLRLAGLPRMKGTSRDLGAEAVEAQGLIPELVERQGADTSRALLVEEDGDSPSTTLEMLGDGPPRAATGLVGRLASRLPGGSLALISGLAVLGLAALVLLSGKLGSSTKKFKLPPGEAPIVRREGAVHSNENEDQLLGTRWQVQENGWDGIWTRQGHTRTFDAYWTSPGQQPFKSVLEVFISGNSVLVNRTDSTGGRCTYHGILSSDRVNVSGSAHCAWGGDINYYWSAFIYK